MARDHRRFSVAHLRGHRRRIDPALQGVSARRMPECVQGVARDITAGQRRDMAPPLANSLAVLRPDRFIVPLRLGRRLSFGRVGPGSSFLRPRASRSRVKRQFRTDGDHGRPSVLSRNAVAAPLPARAFEPCLVRQAVADKCQTVAFGATLCTGCRGPWSFRSVRVKGYSTWSSWCRWSGRGRAPAVSRPFHAGPRSDPLPGGTRAPPSGRGPRDGVSRPAAGGAGRPGPRLGGRARNAREGGAQRAP
jgi:hypothetical protein